MVIKRDERDGGSEWLIGARTNKKHTLTFNCNNTRQDKKKTRKTPIDKGKGPWVRRRVLVIGKERISDW